MAKRAPVITKKKPKRKPVGKPGGKPGGKPTAKGSAPKGAKRPVVVVARSARRRIDEALVRMAMQQLRTEAQRGPKKNAWAVEDAELFDAAKRYCLDRETQQAVVEEAKPDLDKAKVSPRALISWLVDVRKRYGELSTQYIDKQLDSVGDDGMFAVEQDDQQHVLQTVVNAKVAKAIKEIDLVEGKESRIHALTRLLEHGANVAKIRADAALKEKQAELAEAKTAQIVQRLTALADQVERGTGPEGRPLTNTEIAELMRVAAMGGDVAAHAQRMKGAA